MLKWQHERNRTELTIWHLNTHMTTHMIMMSWHEFFSNSRWHDFYERHTVELLHWYEIKYWVWQRERCLFFFVVSRLLRTIYTVDKIFEHELLFEPTSLRSWRSHTIYSLAEFNSAITSITIISIIIHALTSFLIIYFMFDRIVRIV